MTGLGSFIAYRAIATSLFKFEPLYPVKTTTFYVSEAAIIKMVSNRLDFGFWTSSTGVCSILMYWKAK